MRTFCNVARYIDHDSEFIISHSSKGLKNDRQFTNLMCNTQSCYLLPDIGFQVTTWWRISMLLVYTEADHCGDPLQAF